MLPNEQQSQLKRYRFNHRRQKHNNQQAAICVWISGLIIIIFIILGGIKLVNHHQSAQPVFHSHVSRHVSKSTQPVNQIKQKKLNQTAENQSHANRPTITNKYSDIHQQPIPPQPTYQKQRFASVNNAKEWAKATQQRWLHEGYTNYRVSSDGQGNYYLQFTK